ncbi:MAG: outer membrane beta-barrel protein, partial [Rhodospirillaceae bacterium]
MITFVNKSVTPLVAASMLLACYPSYANDSAADSTTGGAARGGERSSSVKNRSRPNYDPPGVRYDSFLFNPEITVEQQYNDNIYARRSGIKNDMVTVVSPALSVNSDWNNHAIGLNVGSKLGTYLNNGRENYRDTIADINGRLDIQRNFSANGEIQYQHLHEDRGSPNDAGSTSEPVTYDQYTGRTGLFYTKGLINVLIDSTAQFNRYANTLRVGGGIQANTPRDRDEYLFGPRVLYEVVPGLSPFVEGKGSVRQYVETGSQGRDSGGYRLNVGTSFDLGGVTTGEVFVGYLDQSYNSGILRDIGGFGFGGSLLWNPTGLTSITVNVSRNVEETTDATASGFISTVSSVNVDHELLRNVIMTANALYTSNNYQGNNRQEGIMQGSM